MAYEYDTRLENIDLSLQKIGKILGELIQLNSAKAVERVFEVADDRITEAMIEVYKDTLHFKTFYSSRESATCIIHNNKDIMVTITDRGVNCSDPFTPSIAPFKGRCDMKKTLEFITLECSATENTKYDGEYIVDEEVLIKAMIRNGFSFY